MTDKGESGSYEEIQASEIIALIRDGKEVKCHHKIIKGDLDIRKLSEEDKNFFISAPISITFSHFINDVHFSNIIFKQALNFSQSRFNGYAYFNDSKFCKGIVCIGTEFSHATPFGKSVFNGMANFCNAKFYGPAYFGTVLFSEITDFSFAHFNKYASFSGTKFEKKACFGNSCFDDNADFWMVLFNENVDFNNAKFNKKKFF